MLLLHVRFHNKVIQSINKWKRRISSFMPRHMPDTNYRRLSGALSDPITRYRNSSCFLARIIPNSALPSSQSVSEATDTL